MLAKKKIKPKKLLLPVLVVLLAILLPTLLFQIYFWERIYPGVKVAGINVSKMKVDEAAAAIESQFQKPENISIASGDQKFNIPVNSIDTSFDYAKSARRAHSIGRSGNITFDVKQILSALKNTVSIGVEVDLNEEKLAKNIQVVSAGVEVEEVKPSVSLVNDQVIINSGKPGVTLNAEKLRLDIGQNLAFGLNQELTAEKKSVGQTLSVEETAEFKNKAEIFKSKNLTAKFEFSDFGYSKDTLLSFLLPKSGFNQERIDEEIVRISQNINRQPQNSVFTFENNKVKEFTPSKDGVKVDPEKLREQFNISLENLENTQEKTISFEIATQKTKPEIDTSEVNNLGIKELIGRGTSTFRGSIPSRIHNVALATSRVNGSLIKPGETFSFNNALGDISKATGFQEAYVIQNGKTVLGDGGGVCQVSTTLFRAALNTGLPIEERHNHSYRVGYYEQDAGPGLDATVFSPTADLKIKNDTPGHILIQATADTKNLTVVFEFYGTSDGRVAAITKPKIITQTAPPPDVYQDDPTLKQGTVKQIEHRAWGAKTVFDYSVTRDGVEIQKRSFTSVYKPWAAVYLRGTAL